MWTNAYLVINSDLPTTENGIDAYFGLEIAMSICKMNEISDFWSEKLFLGQKDFNATMNRNRFQRIRSAIQVHPSDYLSQLERELDPL
jgi:hypothetical protein